MKSKPTKKQIRKLIAGKCFFCDSDEYEILDLHRIIQGCQGGTYNEANTVVCCCSCHRLVHAGKIIIDKKYNSTKGPLLHYFIEGKEYYKLI